MTTEAGNSITIDQLAEMMNRSFKHLEEKMDHRFGKVEDRLDRVENRLGHVEETLERIENKVENAHENRISRLEDDMRVVKTALGK